MTATAATAEVCRVDGNSPYASGSSVTVLANSGILTRTGYTFAGWNSKADGSGTAYSAGATFIISTDTILYAQWNRSSRTLTVNVSGSGTGTVSSAPAGIMCDKTSSSTATCSNTFTEDVTLTATRTKYSVFQEWSSCIGTGACLVTMDSDKGGDRYLQHVAHRHGIPDPAGGVRCRAGRFCHRTVADNRHKLSRYAEPRQGRYGQAVGRV